MPRRAANVNLADSRRIMRAFKRENIPFRVTLQPDGTQVFEPAEAPVAEQSAYDQWSSERGQS
jgi:hypothetical protein